MSLTVILLLVVVIAVTGKIVFDRMRTGAFLDPQIPGHRVPEESMPGQTTADAPRLGAPEAPPPGAPRHLQLYEITSGLYEFFDGVAYPGELLGYPVFEEGVAYLCSPEVPCDEVVAYALGDHVPISCMALEAIRRRSDTGEAWREILAAIGTMGPYPQYFALACLAETVPPGTPLIGPVLGSTTLNLIYRAPRRAIESLLRARSVQGEKLELREDDISFLNNEGLGAMCAYLMSLDPELGKPLLESLDRLRPRNPPPGPDQQWNPPTEQGAGEAKGLGELLSKVGYVWRRKDAENAKSLIRNSRIDATVADVQALLTADHPQSVLLVGEDGVGKTSLLSILGQQLFDKKWTIFVAGHNDIQAGAIWIGQVEERTKQLISRMQGSKRLVWHVPGFEELVFTGTHSFSSANVMDAILPHIENGSLRVVAEITPSAYTELIRRRPAIAGVMAIRTIAPASREETLDIAAQWLGQAVRNGDTGYVTEVWDLAQQYLADREAPGNVMSLLKATHLRSLSRGTSGGEAVTLDDVIETLASQSGMPIEILDQNRALDLDDLRRALTARVIGQDEAVECLVDRVAMIKAAVLDPVRPLGVFLFAGPTGTGKTEIAKSLAAWLFGSADRLIRVDMSELKDVAGLDRLIGSVENVQAESLADRIRKQPFSVVLLDEFEKAHPNVWDLFLQVFDDARITDRRGQTSSFRNAIIILTVNLGATIQTRGAMGFATRAGGFDENDVRAAIDTVFRREFVNRLDRVVVFRPLDREMIRQILHRELEKAFDRRGLKGRPWVAEWDESAIDFLLERGFTSDLGARPLRRAIEQNLLAPLAETIVRHRFPEGDQFLFVSRRGNSLRVEFVDPDRDEEEVPTDAITPGEAKADDGESLRAIVLQPTGAKSELAILSRALDEVGRTVRADDWTRRKNDLFAEMETPDFWNDPARHSILGTLETVDRVEKGVERAEGLQRRLDGLVKRQTPPIRLVAILAQSLYLLSVAIRDIEEGNPQDAFLLIEVKSVVAADVGGHLQFANRIADMYEAWSDKRNMRRVTLEKTSLQHASGMRAVYGISGYGAHSILSPETGLHVLEISGEAPNAQTRLPVRVSVAPQPEVPLPTDPGDALRLADETLEKADAPNPKIVRRYRETPSPLVRDVKRGWRTGRTEVVFGGDFDLL